MPEEDGKVVAPSASSPAVEKPGAYILQAGSFRNHADADRVRALIAMQGVESKIQKVTIDKDTWHRVRVGPIANLQKLEETRSRLENQHTERRAQLASWREQRSQLTLALHMWAARSGTAKERAVQARLKLEQESGRLPQAEDAFRAAQEAANDARSALQQSESGLQLERANLAHHERTVHALGQRRERLAAELQTLAAPDPAAASALQAGMRELDASLRAAQVELENRQAESAGAVGFFAKPYDGQLMVNCIDAALRRVAGSRPQ